MISNYDVIQTFRKYETEGKKLSMKLSDDEKSLVDSETGEFITTLDAFTVELRRKEHCDFETIYYEHVSLDEVYRCRECGTVIFGGDDEYRYDPGCKCPTCCNDPSVCYNEYWTKEQIESDPEKQKTIDSLIAMQKEMNEAAKRRESRGGLYDWERWNKKFHTKNRVFEITLINTNWDKTRKNTNRYLEIHTWKKSDGICDHCWHIPLSFYDVYIQFYVFFKKLKKNYPRICKIEEVKSRNF